MKKNLLLVAAALGLCSATSSSVFAGTGTILIKNPTGGEVIIKATDVDDADNCSVGEEMRLLHAPKSAKQGDVIQFKVIEQNVNGQTRKFAIYDQNGGR